MLLYDSAVSGNCYKVRLLLTKLGLPFERQELSVFDRSDRSEVLGGLNPALRVPTLVLDDGRTLGESNAILWYFGDGTEYVPDDPYERAQVLQWQFFEQYDHEPNIAVARFWQLADIRPSEADERAKRTGGERALAALERHLAEHEYLVGERYTIADISLYAYTQRRARGRLLARAVSGGARVAGSGRRPAWARRHHRLTRLS